jgi:hypothetical protein
MNRHTSKLSNLVPAAILSAFIATAGVAVVTQQPACTPIASAAVLTAEEDACQLLVLGSSVIPIGTNPAQVTADIKLACGIAETATSYVEQVVEAYIASQTDAGLLPPAAAGPYKPSPLVLAKRGIVIVEAGAHK